MLPSAVEDKKTSCLFLSREIDSMKARNYFTILHTLSLTINYRVNYAELTLTCGIYYTIIMELKLQHICVHFPKIAGTMFSIKNGQYMVQQKDLHSDTIAVMYTCKYTKESTYCDLLWNKIETIFTKRRF